MRLTTKFTLVTSAVLVVSMSLFSYLSLRSVERMIADEAVKDIDNLSETILKTTFHQMLEDDRTRVYQAIEEVSSQKGVRSIRLINKDGIIRYSTAEKEIGSEVDKSGASCNMCHGHHLETPLVSASSMSRSRRFLEADGEEVMGMAQAIYNQPACSNAACHFHPEGAQLLGVLDVTVSLKAMQAQIGELRQQILWATLGLLLVVALSMALVTARVVHRPVRDLLVHTRRLTRGDLNGRIEPSARDELGELEEAFNEMTGSLRRVQDELRELASSLETKVEQRTCEVQDMQGRLVRSEKLASLGELVAGIAHEINNPLTGIMVFSSLMLEENHLAPRLRDDLEVIYQETQRCSGIVRRLLEFSREAPPQMAPEDLNQLLDNTLHLMENQATFHNIEIHREYAQNLPKILVDGNQISQVFMNILINAAQAMPGGGTLALETGMNEEFDGIVLRFRDTGCGIPEVHLNRIFDPFFTTKDQGGTGLGLSVSYGIVENHGGRIEVESCIATGTTFTVRLPVCFTSADTAGKTGEANSHLPRGEGDAGP